MSNLLKSGFVNFREGEARIINSNEIVARRLSKAGIASTEGQESGEGFRVTEFGEMDRETAGMIAGESGNIYREEPVYEGPSPEELLAEARQEIEEMRAAAMQEIEVLRREALEEGRKAGYNDGFAQGHGEALQGVEEAERKVKEAIQETERVRDTLHREYEEKLQEMEPMVIDELTKIYDHVFEAGLKEQSEIIFHLLDTTLHRIDSGKEFIVRVSQADYEYVSARKEELLVGMPGVRMDLGADVTMKRGEGTLETGGGQFACSIDVELQELRHRIHMLAYQKE